jgi:hypothetical protein
MSQNLLYLVTAIKQYYIFKATSFYFGSLRIQSMKLEPSYTPKVIKRKKLV